MTPIGRPVAAVRGGAAALLLELLLASIAWVRASGY
jgi:hypothetical protein